MRLTAEIKLLPTADQRSALLETLRVVNECSTWVSAKAHGSKKYSLGGIHALCYFPARQAFPRLSSAMICRITKKVAESFVREKKAMQFRPLGAIQLNRVLCTLNGCTASIWSVAGRQKIGCVTGKHAASLEAFGRSSTTYMLYRGGEFYILVFHEVPEATPIDPVGVLGVDLGIANIATDSDGLAHSGSMVKSVRHRNRRLRSKLQRKQTRSAKRLLKRLVGKERRFARDVNHCISKQIVATAQRTKRAIALEDLKGIRDRIRARRRQRAVLHSWAFHQLGTFIAYKAALAGVPVHMVDPRNTSRQCPGCGHIAKANRPTQAAFSCQSCGLSGHADYFAAVNIRGRALANVPNVAGCAVVSHNLVTSL